ncbi:hypothetical protein DVV91_16985 [Clostridium botulinum]|uniref:hypothetical protein n=1 Tax=Clostridium botulinum TaxID=1491 RepID=UPI00196775BC|nr:hypothetical protein [Clostridium botulinum]MBN1076018.1 hypothetical protein [Clostridium botulinum]
MKILIVKANFKGVTKDKIYNVEKIEYSDEYGNDVPKKEAVLETVHYKNDNNELWDDCKNIKDDKCGISCLSNEYLLLEV